jgi:hypothetical protein
MSRHDLCQPQTRSGVALAVAIRRPFVALVPAFDAQDRQEMEAITDELVSLGAWRFAA